MYADSINSLPRVITEKSKMLGSNVFKQSNSMQCYSLPTPLSGPRDAHGQ